jgi:hypothetical protein
MQRHLLKRALVATAGVAVVGTLAAVALGSAGVGIVSTNIVPKADNNQIIRLNSDRIKLQTKDATDVRVQTITYGPGGRTGWHHHPGFALVAVQSGEVTVFDPECNSTTYGPNSPNGAAFTEYGDRPLEVRNLTNATATIYAALVAPDADPPVFRVEDDPPAGCA